MPLRLLFLCASGSGRALMAASLLQSVSANRFEIWSTPIQHVQEQVLVETTLQEQAIALLSPDRIIQPRFGLQWDEGVILCSGKVYT
jgi:hypothetical protein